MACAALFPGCVASIASRAAAAGPDIIVADVAPGQVIRYATLNNRTAYAIGTTACNIGDMEANWFSTTNQHPVIATALYRLKGGQFTQIGMSWLKHGFATENSERPGCGTCIPTDGDTLGVGCADTYTAQLNGIQQLLGPRRVVNATSGQFPYPFASPPPTTTLDRRLIVNNKDLNPAQNSGALYFFEALYIAADEAQFGNTANNASWRRAAVTTGQGGFDLVTVGFTVREQPAIFAWKANDPTVKLTPVVVENDSVAGMRGYYWIGAKATHTGGCTWRYEYAVYNMNSHQSVGRVSFAVPPGANARGGSLHPRHWGEPISPFTWYSTSSPGEIAFATEPYSMLPNASNAVYFGMLHNFTLYAEAPPRCDGTMTLDFYRPPARPPIVIQTILPGEGDPCKPPPNPNFSCE